tara:strand:- start:25 stop:276 length:252 start_codon:yes stop_codon:yes gene_type:complete
MVEKSQTRLLNPLVKNKVYECYSCFKGKKNSMFKIYDEQPKQKKELFCGHCRYKFRSTKMNCPYCGKRDYLVERNVTVVDLLA